jgi:hypothetical protein
MPLPAMLKVVAATSAARSCSDCAGSWSATASTATSRFMWMPTSPAGARRPIASVTKAPTSPPWAT